MTACQAMILMIDCDEGGQLLHEPPPNEQPPCVHCSKGRSTINTTVAARALDQKLKSSDIVFSKLHLALQAQGFMRSRPATFFG